MHHQRQWLGVKEKSRVSVNSNRIQKAGNNQEENRRMVSEEQLGKLKRGLMDALMA